jgi:3-hydroxyacyl-[acyl-carrier-protein] dehydratase
MFKEIYRIVPHRYPMIMIDGYKRVSEDSALAEKSFSARDYGCSNGTVLDGVLIECIAQTVAAHHGYKLLQEENGRPVNGMLVSVDTFEFFHSVPDNATISISIEIIDRIGAFILIKGEIKLKETLVAMGQIKVFNSKNNSD